MKLNDITKHELIGKKAKVTSALNKSNIGLDGKIIDESCSTITINTPKGIKRIIKRTVNLEIEIDGQKIKIDGKLLEGRSEERIKLKSR
jgi:RNase P/RNase MRP subunit p29